MIIVGLGNPGKKYSNTRHNVGFMVVDQLVTRNPELKNKIIKPDTFMNRSGEALVQYKDRPEELVVIHDDVDLPLGTIRVRQGGSSGGHKGVQSIIDTVGEGFWRVRIGVDRPPEGVETDDYVLTDFTKDEQTVLQKVIDRAAELLKKQPDNGMIDRTITVNFEF